MPRPRDTAAEAWSRQFDAYRAVGPQERLRRALQMSEDVKEIARSGIRHRHPDWPDAKVQEELTQLLLGVELAEEARPARRP